MKGHRVCILVWNKEQAEGCVKDAKEGQMCCVFLFLHVCVFCTSACGCAGMCVCMHGLF